MLASTLFSGDQLLERIAAGGPERISQTSNRLHPAVVKVQTALLTWDAMCLPEHGADGEFGSESARAVHRFKSEALLVPEAEIIDDVGPKTVQQLDELQAAAEQPIVPPAVPRVRRDIWTLQPVAAGPWHPHVHAYARAVEIMKATPISQRQLSWQWQADIHGMSNPTPPDPWRARCEHFSWFFLPWHRAYLLHFEAIVRSIIEKIDDIDDATKAEWALPYWDWDRQDSRSIPPAFRADVLPGTGRPNPLLDLNRRATANQGVAPLSAAQTSSSVWIGNAPFSGVGAATGFGGSQRRPVQIDRTFGGPLENGPHASVHVRVAEGQVPDMGVFETAGLDPVFWLHHCNIDRLWEVWRTLPNGVDETDPDYLSREFHFLDAQGVDQMATPAGMKDTPPLGYVYENITVPLSARDRGGIVMAEQRVPAEAPRRIASLDRTLTLRGEPEVRIDLAAVEFGELVLQEAAMPQVYLTLEHITATLSEDAGMYGVFLQPVAGEPVLLGALPLFGLDESAGADAEHELSYSFEIGAIASALLAENRWDPSLASFVFRDISDGSSGGGLPDIDIGSVDIFVA